MRIIPLWLLTALLFLILIDACFKYLPPIKLPRMMQHSTIAAIPMAESMDDGYYSNDYRDYPTIIRDGLLDECHRKYHNRKRIDKKCSDYVMRIPIQASGSVSCKDLDRFGLQITCWDNVRGGGTSWE